MSEYVSATLKITTPDARVSLYQKEDRYVVEVRTSHHWWQTDGWFSFPLDDRRSSFEIATDLSRKKSRPVNQCGYLWAYLFHAEVRLALAELDLARGIFLLETAA
ncbi:MAG: hypothetical protein EBR82_44200 [Caulobacteraceae bacterium]|nr:hypothetical protein [Caulobacteraceae bacterium]